MPKIQSVIPKNLKPYTCHGLDLRWQDGDTHALGECPFCGKEKFSVEIETGRARCFVCGTGSDKGGMNPTIFLRELWKMAVSRTNGESKSLSSSRNLLHPDTPIAWGIAMSPMTGSWLVPGYSVRGEVAQLYRYEAGIDGKMILKATAAVPHAIHGANLYDRHKQKVYLCEGPWDGMALWEVMRGCKYSGDHLVACKEASSLLKDANVLAIPGCGSVGKPLEHWLSLLSGKDVVLCFDSDHPNPDARAAKHPMTGCAGYDATIRAARILARATNPPASIKYVHWGDGGYAPELKSGWDVRDELTSRGDQVGDRTVALQSMLERVRDVPHEWLENEVSSGGSVDVEPVECRDWKTLTTVWRKAMLWDDNYEYILAQSFAAVVSTDLPGDQLWFLIISPPSSGKTTIAEAIGVCQKYVLQKDTLTGLYSGFQSDVEGKEDNSLILKMKGKTFIVKDGDTLLKNPNLPAILSQLRALFDRAIRTSFKNKMSRNYEAINTTILINGTESLLDLDESELGQRFLHVVMLKEIDGERESDIMDRMINSLCDAPTEDHDPERYMREAKALTGGYVEYMRDVAREEWGQVAVPQQYRDDIKAMALFVAYMRAKPGGADAERAGREVAGRLSAQLTRDAKCLAIVMNKREVDADVMRYVRRCAMDTCAGKSVDVCRTLYPGGSEGAEVRQIAINAHMTEPKVRALMLFLNKIGVVEGFDWRDPKATGVAGGVRRRWRMRPVIRELYERVVGVEN